MERLARLGVLALLMSLVAACGTPVRTEFTPFHELPDSLAGKTFFIEPAEASLAWATHANQLAAGFEAKGLRRVTTQAAADYGVIFTYEGERQRTWSRDGADVSFDFRMTVVLIDLRRSKARNETVRSYEATVYSTGRRSDINEVVPYMIRATFADWPGANGRSQRRLFNVY